MTIKYGLLNNKFIYVAVNWHITNS